MRHLACMIGIGTLLLARAVLGQESGRESEVGPLHEAFVQRTGGTIALDAVTKQPPKPMDQARPELCEEDADWITGYWTYSPDSGDFVWVSGVWRRSPPGHQWIPGFWKELDAGWVRVRGFWSAAAEQDLNYIQATPPELLEEAAGEPPADGMFWMPGYWAYSKTNGQFRWYAGAWQQLDTDWMFVPAVWLWRPDGYLFVPPYWDYPLEERGCAFATVEKSAKGEPVAGFTPLEPSAIVETLLLDYPNYSCFFQQHYYTHRTFWDRLIGTPTWWAWPTWWTYSWWNEWALFWWWTHPGYPQPSWMTINISTQIWPPPASLVRRMKGAAAPFIVTPSGVVNPARVLHETARVMDQQLDKMPPVIPPHGTTRQKIVDASEPRRRDGVRPLRPSGRPPGPGEAVEQPGPKPEIEAQTAPDKLRARAPEPPSKPKKVQPKAPQERPSQGEVEPVEPAPSQQVPPATQRPRRTRLGRPDRPSRTVQPPPSQGNSNGRAARQARRRARRRSNSRGSGQVSTAPARKNEVALVERSDPQLPQASMGDEPSPGMTPSQATNKKATPPKKMTRKERRRLQKGQKQSKASQPSRKRRLRMMRNPKPSGRPRRVRSHPRRRPSTPASCSAEQPRTKRLSQAEDSASIPESSEVAALTGN